MARVTVEDCVTRVPSRFDLVLLASHRARALTAGAPPTVERENDKDPVISLREIAEGTIDIDELHQSLVAGLQKHVEIDEPEDESMTILAAAEKEWAGVTGEAEKASSGESIDAPAAEEAAETETPDVEEVVLDALVDQESGGAPEKDEP